jgi:hypothetical protein
VRTAVVKVICAWCRREGKPGFIGERDPLDNPDETHGICGLHAKRVIEALPSQSFPGVRLLVVVSPKEADLARYLEDSFATISDVKVIVDRRRGECRRTSVATAVERRRRAGRVSPLGYRLVRFGARRPIPSTDH